MSHTDQHLRALRDHLADCLFALPALLDGGAPALMDAVSAGRVHWPALCEEVLSLYTRHGEPAPLHIRRLLAAADARL